LRFLSPAPPETRGRPSAGEHGCPHPSWLSWRLRTPSEFRGVTRVAPSWLPALPPRPLPPGLAVFLVRPDPGPKPGAPLLGFSSPAEPILGPTARAPSCLDRSREQTTAARRSPGFASRGFLLPRALRRRVPLVAPPRSLDRSRVGEGCQALTGAVLRVLAPLDGSGHARGTHELLRIRRYRGAPTLRGLVSCRSRPWSRPSELSLLEEPYPLSRASCFLAGSRSTNPTARHGPRNSRPLSPLRRPLAAACPKARRTGRPGRRFPGVARTLRVTRCRARLQRPRLESAGLTGYGGRHARFEALLPSRVRSSRDHRPCGR